MATSPDIKIRVRHDFERCATELIVVTHNKARDIFAFTNYENQWRWLRVEAGTYAPIARELLEANPAMVDLVNTLLELDELIAKNPPGGLDA